MERILRVFNKVLILSASVGAGHLRAAQAVEKALRQSNAAAEIKNIDTLQYTNALFRRLYSKSYIDMVNKTPELLGWFYDYFDKPWQKERRRLAFAKLNTRPFVKMLRDERPDIVVCTHFLPAEIISWLKAENQITTPQAIVVTDFDVHAFWLCRHFEHYFVAMDETKAHLREIGLPADKITVSGIPIDPVFAQPGDKTQARRQFSLDPDTPVILVSAGGFGVGPVEKLVSSLMKLRNKAQIVVICGKNADLKDDIEKLVKSPAPAPNVRFDIVGFTDQMDQYMAASDLIVGKTGGLTTSEALARGLAFVIVDPIPGQEQRNADHLLEHGVAVKCNNWPILAYKIDALLDNPARIAAMQDNARRMAKPSSAITIVQTLLKMPPAQ